MQDVDAVNWELTNATNILVIETANEDGIWPTGSLSTDPDFFTTANLASTHQTHPRNEDGV